MDRKFQEAAFVVVLGLAATLMQGQVVATGTYPLGTFDSPTPGFDTINVGNLNAHIAIPVLSKAGRGLPFSYALAYDSSVWTPVGTSGAQVWQPTANWGWQGITALTTGYISYSSSSSVCYYRLDDQGPERQGTYTKHYNYAYHDQWGVAHPFSGYTWTYTPSQCGSNGSSLAPLATDGSGYSYNYSTGIITARNGAIVTPPNNSGSGAGTVEDTNGNEISVNSSGQFTDTTGNVALTVAENGAGNPSTFTYSDTHGNPQSVTLGYTNYTVQTAFGCSGISEYSQTSVPLVSSITFPDGSAYYLTYEATPGASGKVTGRLASVELTQGDTIQYSYSGGNNGIECADGSTAGLTHALNSDSGSAASTWSYLRSSPNGAGTSHTEVVDGLSNHKNYDFVEANNQPSGVTAVYYETNRNVYQGAETGTPVVAQQTCYDGAAPSCTTASFSLPVTQVDTYESLNGSGLEGSTSTFNSYGMQTEAEIWDFGTSSSRGSLLRNEVLTYGYSIYSLPTEDALYDGSGNPAGEILYSYDQTTPTTSSGVPQHVAVSGPRGNLTTATVYANGSTSYSATATYEDTGSLLTGTTPNGTATLTYDSTYVYDLTTSLPTPSSGVALGASETYDTSHTGLPLTSTNPNGQITTFASYDELLRPTQKNNPDGGETTWAYTPTTVTVNVEQTSGVYETTETQLDGYGRQSRSITANGQSGTNSWYQQDTCYDGNGNVSFVSYRYQGSGLGASKECSGTGTTYAYDVLGRLTSLAQSDGETRSYTYSERATQSVDENGVTRISQVDGLGLTTIVCEISSNSSMPGSGSPVSCGTDIAGTGFITSYSYALATPTAAITQGAQTRTFQADWLGRTTSVTEPESGTATYSYAFNSTGLAVTRTRPKANQTSSSVTTTSTTQYDSVGRPVSVTYSDGTPTKTYAYDTATGVSTGTGAEFTDVTQTYLKGRLSLASISGTAGSAFSYDPMGRPIALDECLPSGCGTVAYNRQIQYHYDYAGDLLSSTDGAGIQSTYVVSLASELQSLTSSQNNSTNPPGILSNIQNGPDGPVSFSLGNTLSGVYGYDTPGRLNGGWVCSGSTSPNCTGGTQVHGFSLSWSGNQVHNPCDSSMPGTCMSTGYDQFGRLTSWGNSSEGLTYVYDRWGNRWQQTLTAGSGPQPNLSFNTSTNQVTTSGFVYDAAGNMTADGIHSYTYDAEGNVTQVDGGSTATYVYDALNHRVRTVVGSTITEFVFNLNGQRVSDWNGSTRTELKGHYYWANKPVAYYDTTSGTTHFEHQDWLGTERIRTTYNGGVEGTFTSLPFGDAQTTTSGTDGDPYHFAMLDYDSETKTYHAQFRQYGANQAQWMSPDPYYGSYDLGNPQSFDRYAYTQNNPLSVTDPSGNCGNDVYGGYCMDDDDDDDDSTGSGGIGSGGDSVAAPPGATGNGSGDPAPYALVDLGNGLMCIQHGYPDEGDTWYGDCITVQQATNQPLIPSNGGTGGGGNVTPNPSPKSQQCAAARAKVASLKQELSSPEAQDASRQYFKELAAGALIGCGVGVLGTEAVTTGAGAVVGGPPGAAAGAAVGTSAAVGECAAGAIEGAVTANGVFMLSNLSLLASWYSAAAQLPIAEAQADIACK
jgi:RHS repeat-associated protein